MRKRLLFDLLFVILANAVGWGVLTYFDYLQEVEEVYRSESYMRVWCYAAPLLLFAVYFLMSKNYKAAHPFRRASLFMVMWIGIGFAVGEAIISCVRKNAWVIHQEIKILQGVEYRDFMPRFVAVFAVVFIVVSILRMTHKRLTSGDRVKKEITAANRGVRQV